MTAAEDTFAGWAIVELMGHKRLAGLVCQETIAGTAFLRLDVKGHAPEHELTQFYSTGAVYCITPATEEACRMFIANSGGPVKPVTRHELALPKDRQLTMYDTPDPDEHEEPY